AEIQVKYEQAIRQSGKWDIGPTDFSTFLRGAVITIVEPKVPFFPLLKRFSFGVPGEPDGPLNAEMMPVFDNTPSFVISDNDQGLGYGFSGQLDAKFTKFFDTISVAAFTTGRDVIHAGRF